jgi:hypothetical protein
VVAVGAEGHRLAIAGVGEVREKGGTGMKAFRIKMSGGGLYIVLAVTATRAIEKAIAQRKKEYPDSKPDAGYLEELEATVLP